MKKYLLIGLTVGLATSLLGSKAFAATMSNDNYSVENHEIKIGVFKPISPKPTPTPEPEKPFASGDNYTVTTTSPTFFTFATSHQEIDFGKLTATNPVIRLLYLTSTSTKPYHILVAENHSLTDGAKSVPDTTCDNGSCSQETDAIWTSELTYGFGYQLKTMPEENYRQFPDWSQNEALVSLFEHTAGTQSQDQVSFKVNIPATQQAGQYQNVVSFIATPAF